MGTLTVQKKSNVTTDAIVWIITPTPKTIAAPIMPLLKRALAESTFLVSSPAYIYVIPLQIINMSASTPLTVIKNVLTLKIIKSRSVRVIGLPDGSPPGPVPGVNAKTG